MRNIPAPKQLLDVRFGNHFGSFRDHLEYFQVEPFQSPVLRGSKKKRSTSRKKQANRGLFWDISPISSFKFLQVFKQIHWEFYSNIQSVMLSQNFANWVAGREVCFITFQNGESGWFVAPLSPLSAMQMQGAIEFPCFVLVKLFLAVPEGSSLEPVRLGRFCVNSISFFTRSALACWIPAFEKIWVQSLSLLKLIPETSFSFEYSIRTERRNQ